MILDLVDQLRLIFHNSSVRLEISSNMLWPARYVGSKKLIILFDLHHWIVLVLTTGIPVGVKPNKENVQFYDDVSEEIERAGSDEFVMLLGDMNGHVGVSAQGYEGVHGGYGYGVRNEEGCRAEL